MVTVRSARAADIEDVVDLWDSSAGPTRMAGGHDDAARLIARDPDALVIAVDGGRIVGTLVVGWDGWRCHMYRMAVRQDVRRRGVASMLLDEARRRAVALGAKRIDAMVHLDNDGAIEFWERAGFDREHENGRWSLLL